MNKLSQFVIAFFAVSGLYISLAPPAVSAVSPSDFNPGRIIDDSIFYNNNAMGSAQGIQDFLNAHVPTCDTWGTGPSGYGNLTKAQYAQQMGWHGPPYACLQNYHENPTTGETSFEKGGGAFAGGQSAAQIIWDASQEYGINPQVLLVMLRKESAGPLTADNWPLKTQYKYAMGYGCPDSGPNYSANCAAAKSGFYNQMRLAAWQLRYYANNIDTYNYQPNRTNYIQYNPDPNCGGKNVFIENVATASLYIYTPYVPNDGALNAYPGTAPCGAYGNRNFFMMFNEWFGSTTGPDYQATFHSQSSYPSLEIGTTKKISFMFKNTGRMAWGDDVSASGYNPVRLATDSPINRSSAFRTGSWLSENRTSGIFSAVYRRDGTTLTSDQHVVRPGEYAKFEFDISPAMSIAPGEYIENFILVREGASDWAIQGSGAWTKITVPATYRAQFFSQSEYPSLRQNEADMITLRYKNVSNVPWYDSASAPQGIKPVHLATSNAVNRKSDFGHAWPSPSRPALVFSAVHESDAVTASADQHIVHPGQIATFSFPVSAMIHQQTGNFREHFRPIVEGSDQWNMEGEAWIQIKLEPGVRKLSYHSQSTYPTIAAGSSAPVFIDYKNTGNTTLYDSTSGIRGVYPLHLATSNSVNRQSAFYSAGIWASGNRPATTFSAVFDADGSTLTGDQHIVKPGQIVRFGFLLTSGTSQQKTTYREYFRPIFEAAPGSNWDTSAEAWLGVTVN